MSVGGMGAVGVKELVGEKERERRMGALGAAQDLSGEGDQ